MNVFLLKTFQLPNHFHPNKYKFIFGKGWKYHTKNVIFMIYQKDKGEEIYEEKMGGNARINLYSQHFWGGVAPETTAYAATVPQTVYNGWEQKSDGMHYYQFGKELKDTGIKIDGYWYYFDAKGKMLVSGWREKNGGHYYYDGSGHLVLNKGMKISGKWYYLDGSGKRYEAQFREKDGNRYYYDENGCLALNREMDIAGKHYRFMGSGAAYTGILESQNGTYYYQGDGSRAEDAGLKVDGYWRYFQKDGKMLVSGWREKSGGHYYYDGSGCLQLNKELTLSGKRFYVDGSGRRYENQYRQVGSDLYYYGADGVLQTMNGKPLAETEHNYKLTKTVAATCTADGYKEYTCSNCGNVKKEKNGTKLGHNFSVKAGHKNSTCKEHGYDTYKCSRCSETKKTELPLADHQYSLRTTAATCTTDGYKKYTCSICGTSYQETLTKLGHNYQLTKTVAATCTEDGYKQYNCSRCNSSYRTTLAKTGHDYQISRTVEATCTTAGYKLQQCSRCNDTNRTEIPALGHDYRVTKTVAATCTTDGYKELTCSRCNATSREVLTKLGHDYDMDTEIERVASTCGTHGHVNYACKVCGDIKSVELELDPTKHSFEETSSDLQYVTYTCSECGETKREFNDKEYTIDLGNGQTTTVVGHFDLEMRQEILNLVNEKRANFGDGVPALALASDASPLQDVANIRAVEITNRYSHTRPNGERAISSFYMYAHTDGENLAMGQRSASEVCNAWFASPTHRDNIIENSYSTIGIAVFCKKLNNGGYANYFSQMFSTL